MVLCLGQVWTPIGRTTSQASNNIADVDTSPRVRDMMERIQKQEGTSILRTLSATVTCWVGWLHFCNQFNKYTMVKNTGKRPNVGPRPVVVNRSTTEEQMIDALQKVFFPRGRSIKGGWMDFHLGNCKGGEIDFDNILNAPKPHVYLLSKEKRLPDFEISSSDSETSPPASVATGQQNSLSVFSANIPHTHSVTIQGVVQPTQTRNKQFTFPSLVPQTSDQLPSTSTPSRQLGRPVQLTNIRTGATNVEWSPPRTTDTYWNETGTPEVCMQARKCAVCYDRDNNAFLVPCAHKFCSDCANHLLSMGQRCPLCRLEIANVGSLVN